MVVGSVEIQSGSKVNILKSGDPIFSDSVIHTGDDARAKLLFVDRTVIDLGTRSDFRVEEFKDGQGGDAASRQVAFAMGDGKVRAKVTQPLNAKGRFILRTKAASMGVRGTEFIALSQPVRPGSDELKTQITVLEGKVEVTDRSSSGRSSYQLGSGQQYNAVAQVTGSGDRSIAVAKPSGDAPRVVELSQGQLAAVSTDIKIEDKSFKEPERKPDAAPPADKPGLPGQPDKKDEKGKDSDGARAPGTSGTSGNAAGNSAFNQVVMEAVRDLVVADRAPGVGFVAPPPKSRGFGEDPLQNVPQPPKNLADHVKLSITLTHD